MSDAAATVAPAKSTKKRAAGATKAKKHSDHPKYSEMITAALSALKERGGSSRHAILKYIVTHYKLAQDEHIVNSHLKMALRAGVKNGSLNQAKGSGASGSFRLGEKAEKKAAKPKAAKKPKAAGSPKKSPKPKKAAATGAAKPKKPKAEKKAKSPAKAKSPTKAKAAKPKTTKKPKAAKSPKKPTAAKAAKPKSVSKKTKAAKSS